LALLSFRKSKTRSEINVENLEHAIALHFIHYNFCRVHQTIRVTPAMEAGIADHVWNLEEVVRLLDKAASEKAA